jgi:hypothetical protein
MAFERERSVSRLGRISIYPRAGEVRTLGTGSLACPQCDAPVAIAGVLRAHDALSCPYCETAGPLRDFLSLAEPTRPARVIIRVCSRLSRSPLP